MRERRSQGEIIKKWTYHIQGTKDTISIPLRYYWEDIIYGGGFSAIFAADIDEPCPIHKSDKDAEKLNAAVRKELDAFFSISWEAFYLVEVVFRKAPQYSGRTTEICRHVLLSYRPVELGTRSNGDKVHRFNERSSLYTNWPKCGQEEKGTFNNEPEYSMKSLVLATPENKASLDSIINAMEQLAHRLQDFMGPKNVLNTLANTKKLLTFN